VHEAPAISRREWRAVLLYALFVAVLTTIPYVVAYASQNGDWRFGGFLFGVEDGNSYIGKMRLGARGLWDFYLFYTPEAHAGAPLVFLPYIVPGHLVGQFVRDTDPALPMALALVFHAMRVLFDALLVVVLYRFIAAFIRRPNVRMTALILATFGGGLGWLLAFAGASPPEFYIPEDFSFLILFGLPHLALARAALLGGLLLMFNATSPAHPQTWRRGLRYALLAGGCWLVVGLAVPFYFAIVYVILGAWGLALWIRCRAFPVRFAVYAALAAAVTVPLFAYYTLTFSTNAAFAQWSAQNQLVSPSPLHYALAFIVLAIPALVGGRWAWRRARVDERFALLVGWPLVVPLLVYIPLNVQRRMAEAVIVPLAILAAVGLDVWARAWAMRRRGRSSARRFGIGRAVVVALASVSSAILLLGSFTAAANPRLPLFRPADELAAFAWLNTHAVPDDVVLSSVATGNALPAYTNLRPFMGHGPETLDWPHKTRDLERFYRGEMTDDERAGLLRDYHIRYVFYGPLEQALSASPPVWTDNMTPIYDAEGYIIFMVLNPSQNKRAYTQARPYEDNGQWTVSAACCPAARR
jgi:hypothetical protein